MERLVSVLVVLLAGAVALLGFWLGERRRRRSSGQDGPRPSPSIGEAIQKSRRLVLVIFLSDDEESLEAGRALAEDPAVIAVLRREGLTHTIVRWSAEGPEVAAALFEKYAGGGELASGPVCLLLNAQGGRLGVAEGRERGPLPKWLGDWTSELDGAAL